MDWSNQFKDVADTELLRTTVEIPHKINAQIKNYEPKTGVLQNTISILLTKLSYELRDSNLEPGDRYAYQRAIANCTIQLDCGKRVTSPEPTTGSVNPVPVETPVRNDGRGTSELARKAPRTPKSSDSRGAHERHGDRKHNKNKVPKA